MNKWFENTFLESLFNRYGTNSQHWLSAKQTEVCIENMEAHTTTDEKGRHKYYTCAWNDRKVTLQYSSKNGCGTIHFSNNPDEIRKADEQNKKEQATINAARIERIKKNPARLEKRIAELRNSITALSEDLKENDYTAEFTEQTKKMINEAKTELKLLTA